MKNGALGCGRHFTVNKNAYSQAAVQFSMVKTVGWSYGAPYACATCSL